MAEKKKNQKSEKVAQTTAFAPRKSGSRPLLGITMAAVGLLIAVAYIGYRHNQPFVLQEQLHWLAGQTDLDAQNPVGRIGAAVAVLSFYVFGVAAALLPLFFFFLAWLFLFQRGHRVTLVRLFSFVAALASLAGLCTLLEMHVLSADSAQFVSPEIYRNGLGGYIGTVLYANLLEPVLSFFGGGTVLLLVYVLSLVGVVVDSPARSWENLMHRFHRSPEERQRMKERRERLREERKQRKLKEREARLATKEAKEDEAAREKLAKAPVATAKKKAAEPKEDAEATDAQPKPNGRMSLRKKTDPEPSPAANDDEEGGLRVISGEKVEKAEIAIPERKGAFIFPTLDLLSEPPETAPEDAQNFEETANLLVSILDQFGVKVSASEIHTGPVITRYEVKPHAGVRVEKIVNLDKNIALGLKAEAVRILAPVPGKGTVGIEIPNATPSPVCIREIIESNAWAKSKAEIPVVLGKEVTGKPVVADLTKMPHMLIAGSTGSGKTVCINAVIASLLYHASPEDLRFIMVDPKIVEMQVYNSLPHMLIPVVTEPKKVPGALKWLLAEMEKRYRIFAKVGVRNIAGFNAKIIRDRESEKLAEEMDKSLSPEERAAAQQMEVERDDDVELEVPNRKLPYIVCIIDELADLMMVAPQDIETGIARLAQLARAAGIHLIIATQRPSVNVITGVIKANLPSRISFKVASKVDSRTILDGGGADKLIGKGDMLFIPPGTANMIRAQGAFVSDEEINSIVDFLKRNGPPQFAEDVQRQIDAEGDEGGSGSADEDDRWDDPLVPQALDVIRTSKRASTSMLQRRLKIGYNRAARIMEILEEEEIVGPENGSSPREILKDLDYL